MISTFIHRPTRHGRSFLWFVLFFISASSAAEEAANLVFVHLSDPHLFDENKRGEATLFDEPWNWELFVQSIAKINKISEKTPMDFVVVTGDLGLEPLIHDARHGKALSPAASYWSTHMGKFQVERLGAELEKCLVHRWFFVPGNNDLDNEEADTIEYYSKFIESLQGYVQSNPSNTNDWRIEDLSHGSYRPNNSPYIFFGLDNSSFKNDYKVSVYQKNHTAQMANLDDLLKRIESGFASKDTNQPQHAFLFFHVPEVDDPFNIDQEKGPADAEYPLSAWFSPKNTKGIYERWHIITADQRVAALFAGHFHTNKRDRYLNFNWLSAGNTYPALDKLFIAPPLALKFQNTTPNTARGFQIIQILPPEDPRGGPMGTYITDRDKPLKIRRTIYWYAATHNDWIENRSAWPDTTPADKKPPARKGFPIPPTGTIILFLTIILLALITHGIIEGKRKSK